MQKCDICNKRNEHEDDVLLYGEWMTKQNVTVHYYCLLLSTHVEQRGGDSSGILGFLLRDIRKEITVAQKRKCAFCKVKGASVFCFTCGIVFHVSCGLENRCTTYFCDDFRSYCEHCTPLNSYQKELLAKPPKDAVCDICFRAISPFLLHTVTYGDCCRKGFAHRTCMRRYALASGYYLRCLWCRDKNFHDTIRLQSVFVPDRDATWERQRDAYSELHRRHLRCEQLECICPRGRDYNKNSWLIDLCTLCASTGTHLKCRMGTLRLGRNTNNESDDYKCSICLEIEQKLLEAGSKEANKSNRQLESNEQIDNSFYLLKNRNDLDTAPDDDVLVFSDDDASTSDATIITVIPSQRQTLLQNRPSSSTVTMMQSEPDPVIDLLDEPTQALASVPQPPLLLHESFNCANYFYLVVYDYNEQVTEKCMGTYTLRFALDDERIKDRSEEALIQLKVNESDIWFRDSNRGIYEKVDQYTQ